MGRSRVVDRRAQRQERRASDAAAANKMQQPRQQFPLHQLLDADGIERIHQKSMHILSEIGIAFLDDPEALEILRAHGVRMEDEIAYFDSGQILEHVSKAPSQFIQLARNPENNVVIGGDHLCFAPVYGPPFVADLDWGRRDGTLLDLQNFIKLAYLSPFLHHSGGVIVEPTDLPTPTRHLDMVYSHIKYSDKAFMGSVTSAENAADSVAMAEILFGAAEIRQNPALISLINISSPRRLDDRMLGALKVYARARQAVIITPFILSGAMSPVTLAGTLAQLNAEALAGIAFAQMVEPGTPVVYGSFQTNIDLQTGSPVFGSPESQLALAVNAQLARRYNLPFRSGGMFASAKIPDAQAGYESIMTMLPAIFSGVNFILHAAGWLEGGLTAGYEKFVLDCELLGMFHRYLQGIDLSDEAFALDAIAEVPPGGHHLGTEHTKARFRTAFFHSTLMDYGSAEQWAAIGSKDAFTRANQRYKQLLAGYQPPALDAATDEALRAFVEQRKREMGY